MPSLPQSDLEITALCPFGFVESSRAASLAVRASRFLVCTDDPNHREDDAAICRTRQINESTNRKKPRADISPRSPSCKGFPFVHQNREPNDFIDQRLRLPYLTPLTSTLGCTTVQFLAKQSHAALGFRSRPLPIIRKITATNSCRQYSPQDLYALVTVSPIVAQIAQCFINQLEQEFQNPHVFRIHN